MERLEPLLRSKTAECEQLQGQVTYLSGKVESLQRLVDELQLGHSELERYMFEEDVTDGRLPGPRENSGSSTGGGLHVYGSGQSYTGARAYGSCSCSTRSPDEPDSARMNSSRTRGVSEPQRGSTPPPRNAPPPRKTKLLPFRKK